MSSPAAVLAIRELHRAVQNPEEKLSPYSLKQYEDEVKLSSVAVTGGKLSLTPHDFRHGGAAGDRTRRARSLDAIMIRGHWRSMGSVVRYGKVGVLAKQFGKIAAPQRQALLAAVGRFSGRIPGLLN